MKKYVVGFCFSVMSFVVFGQNFTLSGVVTDTQGKPIQHASVVITNTFLGTFTDEAGAFNFSRVSQGTHNLEVSFLGYETIQTEVLITQNTEVSLQLHQSHIQINPVVLTGIRAKETMPFAQTNITQNEVEQKNVGQDITFLLEQTPSFVATSETGSGLGYTNMRIRGTDISRINVTVNGVPLNDPESQGVFWVNMTDFSSSVDNIQIQRGVGTSTNGVASFGASVNIETLGIQEKKGVELSSTIGSFNTVQTRVAGHTGLLDSLFSFSARYSKLTSDGYIQRAFSDHESMHVTGSYFTKRNTLTANVLLGKQRTGITWEGITPENMAIDRTYNQAGRYIDNEGNERFYENETDNYWQNHYSLHHTFAASKNLNISSSTFLITGEGYYEQYKRNHRFNRYGLTPISIPDSTLQVGNTLYSFNSNSISRSDLIREKWLDNVFYGYTLNATYTKDKVSAIIGHSYSIYSGDHFGYVTWLQYDPDMEPHEWYFNVGEKIDFNVFGKIQYQLTPQLSIYGDIQQRNIEYSMKGIGDDLFVLDSTYTWNFTNPKAGFYYKIDNNHSFFSSFAIANREPTRADLRDKRDGEKLHHETLENIEFGYQYRSQKIAFGLNLYTMSYKNQLVLTGKLNDVGNPIKENVEDSYRRGVELVLATRPSQQFAWNANLTLSQNKIRNYVEYATNYDEFWNEELYAIERGTTDISYSPNVIGGSSFMFYPEKNMSFGLVSKYVGEQYFDNTSNAERKLDAYIVHNFKFEYRIPFEKDQSLRIQLFVNNLLNNLYVSNAYGWNWYEQGEEKMERFYFPQAGLHYMCKFTFNF